MSEDNAPAGRDNIVGDRWPHAGRRATEAGQMITGTTSG